MFIVVDLIIIAIFALCVLLGYKRGLAGCLINLLTFFIALAVAIVLFKPVSAIVTSTTQIDENMQTSIVSVFEKDEETKKEEDKEENKSPIMEYIADKAEEATEEKKKEIVNNAAKDISVKIIDVLCFIAIFIVARIILSFIKILADLITKLPIIKQCDKIGGVVYGILHAFVVVFIALALITFISTMINEYEVLELVNKSYIGSILNNNNILLRIIF